MFTCFGLDKIEVDENAWLSGLMEVTKDQQAKDPEAGS
jgi:hypothetical protein